MAQQSWEFKQVRLHREAAVNWWLQWLLPALVSGYLALVSVYLALVSQHHNSQFWLAPHNNNSNNLMATLQSLKGPAATQCPLLRQLQLHALSYQHDITLILHGDNEMAQAPHIHRGMTDKRSVTNGKLSRVAETGLKYNSPLTGIKATLSHVVKPTNTDE